MNARTLLILAVFSSFPPSSYPRAVTGEEAARAAREIVRAENLTLHARGFPRSLSVVAISVLYYQSEPVAYLADLHPAGCMILSDVTELAPTRFISLDSDFAALRDHPLIRSILDDSLVSKRRLGYLRAAPSAPQPPLEGLAAIDGPQLTYNEELWARHLREAADTGLRPAATGVEPLLRSRWNQLFPYNVYTPTLTDSSAATFSTPAGSSAAAQAQIMYYWKYPDFAQGTHSYYWISGQRNLSVTFGHPYEWGAMVDVYTGTETTQQRSAVATLLRDVGYSIDMQYGIDRSVATINANNSLVGFFNYSPELKEVSRSQYPNALSWFEVFKGQLDRKWPVLLGIFTPEGEAHAVVVDGYRTSSGNQVHINMGLGGDSDSYYSLDSIDSFTVTSRQYAVINIHPAIDTLGPSLAITSVRDGDAFSLPTVEIAGTASDDGVGDSGVSSVVVEGDRASGDTASGSGTAFWSHTLTLSSGGNAITVIARDGSPRQNPTTQSLTLYYVEHPSVFVSTKSVSFSYELDSLAVPNGMVLVTSYPSGLPFKSYVADGTPWLRVDGSQGTTPAHVTISADPAGMAPGEYQGAVSFEATGASNNPQSVQVILTVGVAKLVVNPGRIWFDAKVGVSDILAKEVAVSRGSPGGPLIFRSSVESGKEWLSLGGVSGGTTPGGFRVFARPGSRTGVFDGSLAVGVSASAGSPERVPVTLNARERPTLLLSADVLRFSCASELKKCNPSPQKLFVAGDVTAFDVLVSTIKGSGWLSMSAKKGTSPTALTVSVNPTGLVPGSYDGRITLVCPGAINSPQMFSVRLDVTEKTIPLVTPAAISLQARFGSRLAVSEGLSVYTNGWPFEIRVSKSTSTWLSYDITDPIAGTYLGSTGSVLPTRGRVRVLADPTGLPPGTYSGEIIVSTDTSSASVVVPVTLRVVAEALLISQIADGGGWSTQIDIVNTDSEAATFTISFWSQDGEALSIPLDGIGKASEYSGSVPVGGTVTLGTTGMDATVSQGWAEIIADRSIGGAAIFRRQGAGGSEATVPIAPAIGDRFQFAFDNALDFSSGFAIVNTAETESALNVEFRDQNGLRIGSASLTIAPRSQRAFMLQHVFPQTAGARGVAEFSSPGSKLAALGLRFSPAGTFTSFQAAVPIETPYPQIVTHMVPQVADGGAWKTTFVLANLDTTPAPFSIVFYKADGSALNLSLPGLGPRAEYADVIPVGGVRILETEGASPSVAQGWAEIVSSRPIAGTVVFGQRDSSKQDSEGTVQLNPPIGERFVLPFDNSQGFLSALAVLNHSTSESSVGTLTLRDENGQRLSVELLQVSPQSRQVFYLAERFPGSKNRRGSIEYTGDPISILGLRFNPAGSFTSVSAIRK